MRVIRGNNGSRFEERTLFQVNQLDSPCGIPMHVPRGLQILGMYHDMHMIVTTYIFLPPNNRIVYRITMSPSRRSTTTITVRHYYWQATIPRWLTWSLANKRFLSFLGLPLMKVSKKVVYNFEAVINWPSPDHPMNGYQRSSWLGLGAEVLSVPICIHGMVWSYRRR